MGLLIHNVTIFTNNGDNRVIADGAVAVDGTRIVAVGTGAELAGRYGEFERLDGNGRLQKAVCLAVSV